METIPHPTAFGENPPPTAPFVDRRTSNSQVGAERRQFANSHTGLSPDARELAEAIDQYKVNNRRRFITFEEMLKVIHALGYQKNNLSQQ